ncbi:hypothetical protein M885DRAFT_517490, partial [Pelagophyceae sp. CCMP2097]
MRPSAACATLARPSASPAAAARAATAASAAPRARSVSARMRGAASSATSASAALSTAGSMTRASTAAATRARSGPTLADADATPRRVSMPRTAVRSRASLPASKTPRKTAERRALAGGAAPDVASSNAALICASTCEWCESKGSNSSRLRPANAAMRSACRTASSPHLSASRSPTADASKTSGSEKRHFFEASHCVACRATSAATVSKSAAGSPPASSYAKTSKRAHVDSTKASPAGAPRPSPRTVRAKARGAPRVGSEAPSPIVASFHRQTPTHAVVSAQSKRVSRLSSADSGGRASDTTLSPRADTALRPRAGTDTALQ